MSKSSQRIVESLESCDVAVIPETPSADISQDVAEGLQEHPSCIVCVTAKQVEMARMIIQHFTFNPIDDLIVGC